MSGIIADVVLNENHSRPLCVQFQNGKLKAGEEKHLKTALLRSRKNLIAAVASSDILYTGKINRDEDLYNNFLMIRNKKTGKVRLVPIDSAILSPRLNLEKVENLANNNATSVSELNKQFGSKKIKRLTEQKERLTMNIDNVKEQLEQTVASVEIAEDEVFGAKSDENDSAYRPPINRNASSLDQIYNLHDLVPENVLQSLNEEAGNLLETNTSNQSLASYIDLKIRSLVESPLKRKTDKCRLLLFVNYLIKFIITPARSITKRFTICESSKQVNDYILNNFSVVSNTGRTRPLSMRDKTICYILVLLADALDYQVDIEGLSKDVKVGVKKLQELARILAFSSHAKDKNVMLLKLPLPPAVSLTSKKRKR